MEKIDALTASVDELVSNPAIEAALAPLEEEIMGAVMPLGENEEIMQSLGGI